MYSKDRDDKSCEIENLVSQLRKVREENESSTTARRRIEKQLDELLLKNNQLTKELYDKTESLKLLEREVSSNGKRIKEAQEKIRDLERQLDAVRKEKTDLISEHEAIEVEREEEMRALQNGLDGALEQRVKLQHKMDAEFKALRNSFSNQEQQLIDDFEWKLRQIESTCKTKLRDKDNETEEKLMEMRNKLQGEMGVERETLNQDRRTVEEQMRLVCHYKAYEAELLQLRGLTHEQQRALRSAARQLEHFKFNERVLHDEVRMARKQIDKEKTNSVAVQSTLHAKMEAQAENLMLKLEQQKNELNSKWETRVETECSRVKQDLSKVHTEEKHLAVESIKFQKNQEFTVAKQSWAKEMQHLQEKITQLTEIIREMESEKNCNLEKEKENSDLRVKLERVYTLHKESLEELRKNHSKEIDLLRTKYETSQKHILELEKKFVEQTKSNETAQTTNPTLNVNPTSIPSPINQSDSGCGDEESSEESEYDLEEGEGENSETIPASISVESDANVEDAVVHHLRVEVASLQGSIEQLTTNLVVEKGNQQQNDEESDDDCDSEQVLALLTSTFLLTCGTPLALFVVSQSVCLSLWTFLLLLAHFLPNKQ